MVTYTMDELEDIEWAQLVLLGVRIDDIPKLNRQQIATLLAVDAIKRQNAG